MLRCVTIVTALAAISVADTAAAQTCFPVTSDVVSLGQANARAYAERSLDRAIAARKSSIETSGKTLAKVTRNDLACAPFPNLLGADEWRCTGRARVCAAD